MARVGDHASWVDLLGSILLLLFFVVVALLGPLYVR